MTPEPENRLYQAVVLQAFFDATRPLPRGWGEATARVERDRSRQWLLRAEDFVTVCDAALLDARHVRGWARRLAAADWPVPPPGSGLRKALGVDVGLDW